MPPSTSSTKSAARKRAASKLEPLAQLALNALEDVKGQDILVLDVMPLTTVTDTMIICTGTSNRHVKSLAQSVAEEAKRAGHQPLGVEGMDQGEWVLVDLGGVVVHVMQAQARIFYQLEKLWAIEPATPVAEAADKPKRKPAAGLKSERAAAKSAAKKSASKSAGKKASAKARPKFPAKSGEKFAARAASKKPAARKSPSRKSGA
jgi:ribosome-associated protein